VPEVHAWLLDGSSRTARRSRGSACPRRPCRLPRALRRGPP
jgi:hypothetical protein